MAEEFRADPAYVLALLDDILEDGAQAEMMIVLRQLALVHGGVYEVAKEANLNPTQLYRTLSPGGNPSLSSLMAILKAMGLRLAVTPIATPAVVTD